MTNWQKTKLYFADLALLWMIFIYERQYDKVPYKRQLMGIDGLWNTWMKERGVFSEGYAQPITSSNRGAIALKILRELGYITPDFHYYASVKAAWLFKKLGVQISDDVPDANWQQWPVEIPIEDGELNLEKAVYI